jgi:hypothetical protein
VSHFKLDKNPGGGQHGGGLMLMEVS